MRILALDSSSLVASVALITDEILTAEFTLNHKITHSQTLLPMLDQIVEFIGIDLETIDAIAISAGPGSFTGLRIGSATAKGLGLAWNKPLIAVPTLDAMAYNLYGCEGLIVPIMDARRNQVYTAVYQFENGKMCIRKKPCAIAIEELVEDLKGYGQKVTFLGDGVPVFQEKIKAFLSIPHQYAPPHLNRQRAGAVGALAEIYYAEGRIQKAQEHKPEYLRMSQAERERKEKLEEAQKKQGDEHDSDQ